MHERMRDSHSRSFIKAVSWRLLGTFDTFMITLLVTGSIKWAGSITSVESVTKVILFYLHERAWGKLRWQGPNFVWSRLAAFVSAKFTPASSLELASVSSHLPEEVAK